MPKSQEPTVDLMLLLSLSSIVSFHTSHLIEHGLSWCWMTFSGPKQYPDFLGGKSKLIAVVKLPVFHIGEKVTVTRLS